MYYHEACDAEVTRAEAIRELLKHDMEPSDCFDEIGYRETYTGQEILDWLGY